MKNRRRLYAVLTIGCLLAIAGLAAWFVVGRSSPKSEPASRPATSQCSTAPIEGTVVLCMYDSNRREIFDESIPIERLTPRFIDEMVDSPLWDAIDKNGESLGKKRYLKNLITLLPYSIKYEYDSGKYTWPYGRIMKILLEYTPLDGSAIYDSAGHLPPEPTREFAGILRREVPGGWGPSEYRYYPAIHRDGLLTVKDADAFLAENMPKIKADIEYIRNWYNQQKGKLVFVSQRQTSYSWRPFWNRVRWFGNRIRWFVDERDDQIRWILCDPEIDKCDGAKWHKPIVNLPSSLEPKPGDILDTEPDKPIRHHADASSQPTAMSGTEFSASIKLRIWMSNGDGSCVDLGATPSDKAVIIPKDAAWYVQLDSLAEWPQLQVLIKDKCIPGLEICGQVDWRGLESLSSLKYLDLSHSQITDDDMKYLSGMANLESLDLSATGITNSGLRQIARLENLRELDISDTRIDRGAIGDICAMSKLRTLKLSGLRMGDAAVVALSGLTNLTELDVSGAEITDAGMDALAKMKNLRSLSVRNIGVTDEWLSGLCESTRLECVDFSGTKITSKGVARLAKVNSLRGIGLGGLPITWADIEELKDLDLKRVTIPKQLLLDAGPDAIRKVFPHATIFVGQDFIWR